MLLKIQETLFWVRASRVSYRQGADYFSVAYKFLLVGFLNAGPYCIVQSGLKMWYILVFDLRCSTAIFHFLLRVLFGASDKEKKVPSFA